MTRRDTLLKRLQSVLYGMPRASAAAKRARFFGVSRSDRVDAEEEAAIARAQKLARGEPLDAEDEEGEKGEKKAAPVEAEAAVATEAAAKASPSEVVAGGAAESGAGQAGMDAQPQALRVETDAAAVVDDGAGVLPTALRHRLIGGGPDVGSPAGGDSPVTPATALPGQSAGAFADTDGPDPTADLKRVLSDAASEVPAAKRAALAPTKAAQEGAVKPAKASVQSAGLKSDPKQGALFGFFRKA